MSAAAVPPQTGQVSTYLVNDKPTKQFFTTPNPFEQQFGYHRAVRRGPFIFVSGTTALKDVNTSSPVPDVVAEEQESKVHYPKDARLQAVIAMNRCIDAVKRLGGMPADIVRVKMFVARYEDCGDVGTAFKECFATNISDETVPSVSRPDGQQFQVAASEIGAAATMVVVRGGFVDPDILVEVEIDAVVV